MLLQAERIALVLKDGPALYFDYCPLWAGFYVLDAQASPTHIVEAGRESVRHAYYRVWDEDLKMFFRARDDTQEVGNPLVVRVGVFNPEAQVHSSGHTCTIPGGVVISASIA